MNRFYGIKTRRHLLNMHRVAGISLLVIPLLFSACKREESTDLKFISRHFWKKNPSRDSVLTIGTYKETASYLHYWVSLHKKPYKVDTGLLSTLEAVDNRTIYLNKMQRVSHDHKRMLRKGLIKKSPGLGAVMNLPVTCISSARVSNNSSG